VCRARRRDRSTLAEIRKTLPKGEDSRVTPSLLKADRKARMVHDLLEFGHMLSASSPSTEPAEVWPYHFYYCEAHVRGRRIFTTTYQKKNNSNLHLLGPSQIRPKTRKGKNEET
jgi:hypothetical protein